MKELVLVLTMLGLTLVSGCVSESHISGDPKFPTGYTKGAVYVLQKDTYGLIRHAEFTSHVTALELRPDLPPHIDPSFAEFVRVPSGTRLIVDDVLYFYTFEQGTRVIIQARFLTGEFKGKDAVVDRISIKKKVETAPAYWLPIRNPAFLYEEKPNQSLEPTTMLGTSAAEQPLVPSRVVAHL